MWTFLLTHWCYPEHISRVFYLDSTLIGISLYSKFIQAMIKYNQYDCLAHVVLRLMKVWKRLNGQKLCCKANFRRHGIILFIVYHHLARLEFWIKRVNNEDMGAGIACPIVCRNLDISQPFIYTNILDWKSALPALLLNTVLIYTMSGISRDINNIH